MTLIDRLDRKASLMGEMMRRTHAVGNEAVDIVGDNQIRNAVWRCLACADGDRCEAWLERAADDSPPPGFCRNRHMLKEMRALNVA